MTMKSKAYLIASMAAMMMGGESGTIYDPQINAGGSESDKEKYKKLLEKRGVKEFTINGHTVTALNYKSAVRKANKKS